VDTRSRPAVGTTGPGTDPAALRVITVAVLAGLVVSGIVVISRHSAGGIVRASPQAMARLAPSGLARSRSRPAPSVTLLDQAARACRTTAYAGVEVLGQWGGPGPATSVVNVWHAPGGVALAQPVAAAPRSSGEVPHIVLPASYLGDQALVGSVMLGMSPRLVELLGANFRVTAAGWGQVAGRPARVVTARRSDGRLAARLWLDKATTLPLRRETFDDRGRMVSEAAFAALTVGPAASARPPGAAPRPWVTARPARLRAQGWPVPDLLPGGLVLLGAREDHAANGPVVDLDYSDGLSLVSVFLQRGHLQSRLTGWSRMALGGSPVYADDTDGQTFVWSAHGFVYTLVAAAPPQTVAQVVAALPHDGSPGVLVRLGQGMHRMLSWLIP
jgi:sigma-E factor negative regulatory protein RseB